MRIEYGQIGDGQGLIVELSEEEQARRGTLADTVAIPLAGIASWAELLGYIDVVDVVDAILSADYTRQGTDVDEDTGENPWTAPYLLEEVREEAREREALRVQATLEAARRHDACLRVGDEEGRRAAEAEIDDEVLADPRSLELRCALAAREAVLAVTGCTTDVDSPLARCQADARAALGLPDPERRASVVRCGAMTCDPSPHTTCTDDRRRLCGDEDRADIAAVLREHMDEITECRRHFLHGLSPYDEDPLAPAAPAAVTLDTIRQRYTEEEAA